MVKFCPTCKKIHPLTTTVCPVCSNARLMAFCEKCRQMVPRGEIACPTCGDVDTTQIQTSSSKTDRPKKKKGKLLPVLLTLVVLAVGGVAAWWFLLSDVDRVTLEPQKLELTEGETVSLEYTLSPKWAFPKGKEWSSTSESIATVDQNGKVTALKKGTCTIFFTANGISGDCKITVKKDGTDLEEIYKSIEGDGVYCRLAYDGSYISVDTIPDESKDFWEIETEKAIAAILLINQKLGIPDSVLHKMNNTRALDGRQTETYGDVEVSWTYHPDHGLEVLYTIK